MDNAHPTQLFRLLFFYFHKTLVYTSLINDYYYFKTKYLEDFSIPDCDPEYKRKIVAAASQIVDSTISTEDSDANSLIYDLYSLSDDERIAIEAAIPPRYSST